MFIWNSVVVDYFKFQQTQGGRQTTLLIIVEGKIPVISDLSPPTSGGGGFPQLYVDISNSEK